MSYDIATINQAWYIACEECMENQPEYIGNGDMFLAILDYCNRHSYTLLRDAAKELKDRQENYNDY